MLVNAVLLFGVAGVGPLRGDRAARRDREMASLPVLVVGVIGLLVNLVAFAAAARAGASESLNVRARTSRCWPTCSARSA